MISWIVVVGFPETWHTCFNRVATHKGVKIIHLDWHEWASSAAFFLQEDSDMSQNGWSLVKRNHHVLDLDDIKGLLCCELNVPYHCVNPWPEEDRPYVHGAMQSYWLSSLDSIVQVYNRLTPYMLSPSYLSLPSMYHLAKRCGLSVPDWSYSTNKQTSLDVGFLHYHLGEALNLVQGNDEGLMALKKPIMPLYFCLVIGCEVYWMLEEKALLNNQKKDLYQAMMLLVKELNLSIAQLCFSKNDNGHWVFYHITPTPYWDELWVAHKQIIINRLVSLFDTNPTESDSLDIAHYGESRCYITRDQRPLS
ncbi:MAG: hypothetical protein VXY77_02265 [Pseudomonadota bacterium]|nr:hypothetical protein [Pseudomonadota bacterium]